MINETTSRMIEKLCDYWDNIIAKISRESMYDICLNSHVPLNDSSALKFHPHHSHMYDKKWLYQSQKIKHGDVNILETLSETDMPKFPICILPRYGHDDSSTNRIIIREYDELNKYYNDISSELVWCEYIDEREYSSDCVLYKGELLTHVTGTYVNSPDMCVDQWRFISPHTNIPPTIYKWIKQYTKHFTGIINLKYIREKILEVRLCPCDQGLYINETRNNKVIDCINQLFEYDTYDTPLTPENKVFQPYYVFTASSLVAPIILFPAYISNVIMKMCKIHRFNSYWFRYNNTESHTFYRFVHDNFDAGIHAVNVIEALNYAIHAIFVFLLAIFVYVNIWGLIQRKMSYMNIILIPLIVLLYSSTFLNNTNALYGLLKIQQIYLGFR